MSVLKAIGREDVLVFPGAAKPFCREAVHADSIHGETGLDGTTLLPPVPDLPSLGSNFAVEAMYKALASTQPGTAWLVTTGALTNAALLFNIYPELADHIAGLSIMGGVVGNFFTDAPLGRFTQRPITFSSSLHKILPYGTWSAAPGDSEPMSTEDFAYQAGIKDVMTVAPGLSQEQVVEMLDEARISFGNWTNWSEFNIYIDPESSQAIFRNPVLASKTTLIPLDVTHQVLANEEMLDLLRLRPVEDSKGEVSNLRTLFLEILTFFTQTYEREFGMNKGPPLHDPVAVAAALYPAMFDDNDGERFIVHVITDGDDSQDDHARNVHNVGQCGRTMVKMLRKGEGGVRIPRSLDILRFWGLVGMALDEAEKMATI